MPAPTRTAPIVNAVAPVFRLPLLGGSSVDLSRLHGRVVVVNFFATWCPPCRAETPDLNSAEKRYGRNGVAFLGVDDRENPALVEAFVRRKDIRYPVALDADGAISKRYDVRAIPTTYVIDRLGVVRYRQVDQLDRATLSAALDAALTGRAVPQSEAARRFESTAVTAARQVRAIAATAASALAARNAGVAQTDADDAIKIATAAGRRLDSLQAGPEAASIDYFKSTHERDALNAALADVYDVRAHAGSRNQSGDAEQAALLRGQIAQDRERFAEAERWYLRAVALAPRDVAGYAGEYLAAYEMH
ncbi:MAG: TlpA family protein disulfide reductase, partial [Candidatus Eremiobacteraeota bacterium]|nr:TlpA family protein disulfide reductase [Candidatus Eremiobacteraeota bacterium]